MSFGFLLIPIWWLSNILLFLCPTFWLLFCFGYRFPHCASALWGQQPTLSLIYMGMPTQLCSTLCDPMDCSPLGSSVHGIFGVGCHFLLQEIFLIKELSSRFLCLLHWQVYSLPVNHLGSETYIKTLSTGCALCMGTLHNELLGLGQWRAPEWPDMIGY